MDLRERKQIINGATESLPEYSEGKWLHGIAKRDIPGMVTTGINFAGSVANSFGPVKSAGDILQESGTSVGQGSGFSYQKQNAVDVGAQMDELSKQNTANTLNTAASGASLGSAFGPIGAGIGGVVGGAVGFIGGLFRKNKMAERIRQAQIQAVRNNDFNLASAQTDYLTNQYNVEHDNTQDDLIYSAKDGMVPGFDNGKANAKVSNGEFVIDTFTGKTGRMPGKPNKKDSLLVHLDNPDGTAIVSNNKLADGIRNSDYFAMTGDLNGALMRDQIYRDMKDYRTVKQLHNEDERWKLPKFADGSLANPISPWLPRLIMSSGAGLAPHGISGGLNNAPNVTKVPATGLSEDTMKRVRSNITGPIDTTNSDNSNWANAITSGMGILGGLSQILQAKNEPLNRPNIEAQNPYERQSLAVAASLSPNTNAKLAEMAHAEARNRYNLNRMGGLSGAQKYQASVAGGVGLQENIAKVLGLDQQERNGYKTNWSKLAADLGAAIASRRMTANQYLEEAYARSHGARTQMEQMGMQNMLAAFNQYYKNLDKLNRFNRTMAYYDQDYQLRKDALNKGWG